MDTKRGEKLLDIRLGTGQMITFYVVCSMSLETKHKSPRAGVSYLILINSLSTEFPSGLCHKTPNDEIFQEDWTITLDYLPQTSLATTTKVHTTQHCPPMFLENQK